mmetsp:Transcript_37066/g.96158  ORF Transcript_37066/g.96158 Transcript_37066/m.96158 type:complete len:365 (-) Transcript_37066:417-1511(-)
MDTCCAALSGYRLPPVRRDAGKLLAAGEGGDAPGLVVFGVAGLPAEGAAPPRAPGEVATPRPEPSKLCCALASRPAVEDSAPRLLAGEVSPTARRCNELDVVRLGLFPSRLMREMPDAAAAGALLLTPVSEVALPRAEAAVRVRALEAMAGRVLVSALRREEGGSASTPVLLRERAPPAVRRCGAPLGCGGTRPEAAKGGRRSFGFLSTQPGSSCFTRSKSSFGKPIAASSASRRLSSAASRPGGRLSPPMLTCTFLNWSPSRRAISDTSRSSSFMRELIAVVRRSSLSTSCGRQMNVLTCGSMLHSSMRTLGTRSYTVSTHGSRKYRRKNLPEKAAITSRHTCRKVSLSQLLRLRANSRSSVV